MKIGIVTDDGTTVSSHFGLARHYLVVEAEDGVVKGRELRQKPFNQAVPGVARHLGMGGPHLLSGAGDCEALVARGMGRPMYENIRRAGSKPYLTKMARIDDVVRAYLAGHLDDHPDVLH